MCGAGISAPYLADSGPPSDLLQQRTDLSSSSQQVHTKSSLRCSLAWSHVDRGGQDRYVRFVNQLFLLGPPRLSSCFPARNVVRICQECPNFSEAVCEDARGVTSIHAVVTLFLHRLHVRTRKRAPTPAPTRDIRRARRATRRCGTLHARPRVAVGSLRRSDLASVALQIRPSTQRQTALVPVTGDLMRWLTPTC